MSEAPVPATSPEIENPAATRLVKILEIDAEIRREEKFITEAEASIDSLKSKLKLHEATKEKLTNELRAVARGESTTLFDEIRAKEAKEKKAKQTPEQKAEAASNEAWRSVTLEELGIKGKAAESLTEKELTTLGAISDYTSQGGRLIDIPGIGEGKAEKIESAMLAYWEQHPQAKPAPKAEPKPEAEFKPAGPEIPVIPVADAGLDAKSLVAHQYPNLPDLVMGDEIPKVVAVRSEAANRKGWSYVSLGELKVNSVPGETVPAIYSLKRVLPKPVWMETFGTAQHYEADTLCGAAVNVDGERFLVCPWDHDLYVSIPK